MKSTFNMSLKFKIISLGFGTNLALILGAILSVEYARSALYWIMAGLLIASLVAFTWVATNISDVIEDLANGFLKNSIELKNAATKITEGSGQLSNSTLEQSSAIQETASTVDEISSMIRNNADSANKSKLLSAESKNSAEQGRQTVDSMLMAIGEIELNNAELSQQMRDSNIQLAEITKMIHQISNKTKVINEIVFQTKLLSFNASVEAARAGEYGKGFAVVASEVGKLAQMSGGAAKEITEMLQESVTSVEAIAEKTKEKIDRLMVSSEEKINYGTETAKQCKEALNEILSSVESVDKLVFNIASASQEQELGISVISQAIGMLETTTHQNTSFAQNSTNTAEQLKQRAAALGGFVNDLNQYIHGSNGSGHSRRPFGSNFNTNQNSFKSSIKANKASSTKLSLVEVKKESKKSNKPTHLVEPFKMPVQQSTSKPTQSKKLSLVEQTKHEDHSSDYKSASGYIGKIPSSNDPGFGE